MIPTVDFCSHKVTRLIAGANPLYGYSHFNLIMDAVYIEYFTDDRVVQLMLDCEKAGINSWHGNFADRAQRQYPMIRKAGCKMNFSDWEARPGSEFHRQSTRPGFPCRYLRSQSGCHRGGRRKRVAGGLLPGVLLLISIHWVFFFFCFRSWNFFASSSALLMSLVTR